MQQLPTDDMKSADQAPLGFVEFVSLIAAMMALTALGIDSMLPALPAIGDALGVTEPNHRQYVITSFLIGFGVAQLLYGPLSDRFGRRPVLVFGLSSYVVMSALAAISGSFTLLLIARVLMGTSVACVRVVTVAMVRDCYSGRAMARVMSLSFIIFMAAPVIAPSLGQIVLLFGNWRMIFWAVAMISAIVAFWFALRMPETLPAEGRMSLNFSRVMADYGTAMRDRAAIGYTLAIALITGGLFGFIGSIQQIMDVVFGRPDLLAIIFPCVAGTMAITALINSRIVMKMGMRKISHTALMFFIAFAALHLIVAWLHWETILVFTVLQALMMGCLGLTTSNFSALAMERMGQIAGTASSLQGFVTTIGGALIGAIVGQAFDGSTVPLYLGFLLAGLGALLVILITERGRLFRTN